MALTQSQAVQAGQIAEQLAALQTALSDAQAALSGGMSITSHGLTLIDAKGKKTQSVSSGYQLGTPDSVTILTTLIAAYENSILSLTNQLASM